MKKYNVIWKYPPVRHYAMKKYNVIWKYRVDGLVKMRREVLADSPGQAEQFAKASIPSGAFIVRVEAEPAPTTTPLVDDKILKPSSMPSWGTYGT